jgi:F0F1-type ATP synthase membrane subunit a
MYSEMTVKTTSDGNRDDATREQDKFPFLSYFLFYFILLINLLVATMAPTPCINNDLSETLSLGVDDTSST